MAQDIKALEKRIRVLEDKEAIRKVKMKYAYTLDVFDWDGFLRVFAEECSCDMTTLGLYSNKAEMGKFFKEAVPAGFAFFLHWIVNEMIEVTSETTAVGEWYFCVPATRIVNGSNRAMWYAGKYYDEFVKEKGEWKIKFMKCAFDFITGFDTGWVKENQAKPG